MLKINNMVQCFESFMINALVCIFRIIFGFVLLFTQAAYAANNIVTAARVWPAQDYTRITLEAGKPFVYKMTLLKNPERVVVDIENVEFNPAIKVLE